MIKSCSNCGTKFKTKDSRQKSCGKVCADVLRAKHTSVTTANATNAPTTSELSKFSLPPPEELPAPYAKRVHDMWVALVGNADVPTRIA